VAIGPRTARLA